MVELNDMLFIVSLMGIIVILLLKLYNVLTVGTYYTYKGMILTFVTAIILWVINFIIFILNPENKTYMILNKVNNFSMTLCTVFLIAEVLLLFGSFAPQAREGYRSIQAANK